MTPAPGSPGILGQVAADGARTNGARAAPEAQVGLHPERMGEQFRHTISRDFARRHLLISQGGDQRSERLYIADSTPPEAIHNVGVVLRKHIATEIADGEAIARAIDAAYGAEDRTTADNVHAKNSSSRGGGGEVERLLQEADRDLLSTEGKGPVIKLVDALLFEALGRAASDLHVQPLEDRTLVRYRLDGVLHTVRELPVQLTTAVISRIKVMGRMDIAETRIPQDGRATVNIGERSIDLRISTLPTSYGERSVIRLLDNTQHLCDFEKLSMPPDVAKPFLDQARRANGIILVTGPTGSGKTTTLYATLRAIGSAEVNIMTIEDPIEYELATVGLAISQAQVNPKKGVTFATGLRHILRQDPDVVMVGEIRDLETARIAIQSSLTGHLVFSTLHTNDAPSAITRLIDLGIEPYLVSASLSAVLAQRLVRRVHRSCRGEGCEGCLNTGFGGRRGIFELMAINEELRELISAGAAMRQLRDTARASGMRSLHEDGMRLVADGETTRSEVERVTAGAGGS